MGLRKVAVVTPGSFVIPSGRRLCRACSGADHSIGTGSHGCAHIWSAWKGLLQKTRSTAFRVTACHRERIIILPLRRLQKWRPDIIEVHNRPLLAQRLKMHLPDVKTVLNLHSNTFISPPYMSERRFENIARWMDGIVVNSRFCWKISR